SSAVTASKSTASPAGTPSTIATSVWPCDSPAVRNRSIRRTFYPKKLRHPARGERGMRRSAEAAFLHGGRTPRTEVVVELVADRLAVLDDQRVVDLATGDAIVLQIASAGGPT